MVQSRPHMKVSAEDEGGSALWCHKSLQEHKPDQWTHTDLKYSEERRQQTLNWGRQLIDEEYERLHVRLHSVFIYFVRRGVTTVCLGDKHSQQQFDRLFRLHRVNLGVARDRNVTDRRARRASRLTANLLHIAMNQKGDTRQAHAGFFPAVSPAATGQLEPDWSVCTAGD